MIPAFLNTGLLPKGIHWASAKEVHDRLGTNAHRIHLLGGLSRACGALAVAGCNAIYLDGSFVTEKVAPTDYDACWDIAGVDVTKLDAVFKDFSNLRAAQKAKYFGEFFPAQLVNRPTSRTFLQFFQIDKLTGDPKGIIGIYLRAQP
jgi:hypothetical protein